MGTSIDTVDQGRVRFLTLNRPDQLNALSAELIDELHHQVTAAAVDYSVGCLVIRGAGGRAFSAGADLGQIRKLTIESAHEFIRRGHRAVSAVASSAVPVIAAVDGFALGGGFELMLACHVVVASDRSSFGLPEVKIGCLPGFGGTQRLLTVTGKPAALHLMLTGDRIDARRAWEIGLLSVPPVTHANLTDEVGILAQAIASGSRTGIGNMLEAVRQAVDPAALEHEAALAAIAISSADGQEGINSFAERRAPIFSREPGS